MVLKNAKKSDLIELNSPIVGFRAFIRLCRNGYGCLALVIRRRLERIKKVSNAFIVKLEEILI